jgi:hypothetical protein
MVVDKIIYSNNILRIFIIIFCIILYIKNKFIIKYLTFSIIYIK